MRSRDQIDVYLEIGQKRIFAGALDWPGWCRMGRDDVAALQALIDYGPRYARVLNASGIEIQTPADVSALSVVERLEGNASTDFGAPAVPPSSDTNPADVTAFERAVALLKASWRAFDAAVQAASGRELRKGPRGGGRDLQTVVAHVLDADASYLGRLARKHKRSPEADLNDELVGIRETILDALAAAVRGELPERGPRGGVIWTPRYFVRRVAWHVLDHAWEIEDRSV